MAVHESDSVSGHDESVTNAHVLRPTAPAERHLELDVLRGLALFGVLVVNVAMFSGSDIALEQKLPYPWGWGGRWPGYLRSALIESKAAALLAMLFGAGLVIQCERVARQGRSYLAFAFRRSGALALIGIAHTFLLWNGDILLDYAVISLLMIPFLNLRASRTLWAIVVLLPVTFALAAPFLRMAEAGLSYPMELQHYGAGSWANSLHFRAWEFCHVLGPKRAANRLPILTPFFVLGAYFWKQGYFSEPAMHRRRLVGIFAVCSLIGVFANIVPWENLGGWLTVHIPIRPLRILIKAVCFLGRPFLTLGYAAGILLLLQQPWWRRVLAHFAPLGRMTLTQYLLQSLVCTWIFNGYGLGRFGKVSINACILLSIGFFALQVWTSAWWLARFRTGPVEWLWRLMVYGSATAARTGSGTYTR
jgi:uncharacterized protein